jgi:hypothetical protein
MFNLKLLNWLEGLRQKCDGSEGFESFNAQAEKYRKKILCVVTQ